ncbi:GNAT family N-acetyltransferase [Vibrio sp. D420a]|uniref:GNAT family N-acetyltransferase n=1 Tax=Vibrio sp. D420a TaxID=2836895 RepID=UPI002557AACA|nr:GNAT family N-acetyltransferase [Vibrio sp. D420a]MDK9764719.1 GNAT family N-acetyltransferase [Vibrio sp. D420a]
MLVPFKDNDYEVLMSWIDSEELNYLWGGPTFDFPLSINQLDQHYSQKGLHPYLFFYGEKPAGFVELCQIDKRRQRICRVLISNEHRGLGLSKVMLEELISIVETDGNTDTLSLAVYTHNSAAKQCYESLGFRPVLLETASFMFAGQSWDLIRMEMSLPRARKNNRTSSDKA